MPNRSYWLDLFTGTTWLEFLRAGGSVTGFREHHWGQLQKVQIGDYLLCYLTGISRWIGVLEVTSEAFRDATRIWEFDLFPCRVKVKPVVTLEPETAVPVHLLKDRLSFFQELKNPNAWTGKFRSSLTKFDSIDASAVVSAVVEAQERPTRRPVDPAKLGRRPRALRSKEGAVTVPEESQEETNRAEVQLPSDHTEMQWLLLKTGNDMGLDVWVARNDRGRAFDGREFSSLPHLRDSLPLQFDEATNRTIELIDVLWLSGNAIVAAFEIESTTSIYSGLLRMADLITMQPNLKIPLFLVAPDERRNKVIAEVNRPTFARLRQPMPEVCRYISFSSLRAKIKEVSQYLPYLKAEFLDEISESCELEDD